MEIWFTSLAKSPKGTGFADITFSERKKPKKIQGGVGISQIWIEHKGK
jgi:hypothetical protein